jgi:hypothetical protein
MIDLQLPTFGSPEDFQPIEEVFVSFKRTVDEYQVDVKKIIAIKCGHIQIIDSLYVVLLLL